jgi:hypothetical protein
MKIKILILIYISLSFYGYSQEFLLHPDSLKTFQNTEEIQSNPSLNNIAFIQQVGNFNEAIINQSENSGLLPNAAEVNQQGYNNIASSSQNGNSNLSVIGQYGSDNSASLNTIGNYNLAGALQFGNGNTVEQDLIGNGLNFLIFQTGNENFINQVQNQQSSIPMQIHQTGNGMRLIIINGGFH